MSRRTTGGCQCRSDIGRGRRERGKGTYLPVGLGTIPGGVGVVRTQITVRVVRVFTVRAHRRARDARDVEARRAVGRDPRLELAERVVGHVRDLAQDVDGVGGEDGRVGHQVELSGELGGVSQHEPAYINVLCGWRKGG